MYEYGDLKYNAPIVVFAFNRIDVLKKCIVSLLANKESTESELYVFVDGPRHEKPDDNEKVNSVQEYVKTISGFKSVHYQFAETNKGLAPSVIRGVSEIIEKYGRVIVVEDDLFVSHNFLAFMNQGLNQYEDIRNVFSICGYTNIVKRPTNYDYDAYFCTRSSSWGWATWKDRWDSVDWKLENWPAHKKNARDFNKWGGSDCWKMLNDWHEGLNSSWAIRFCYSQFLQNCLSLFPLASKVGNNGFDGRGTHAKKWSRFKFEFDKSADIKFRFPLEYEINKSLYKEALSYHSIPIRIWSRLMYLIHRNN